MMGPAQPQEKLSDAFKIIMYILSFLIWIIGIIVGAIYYTKQDPELKEFGKICLILGLISLVLGSLCSLAFWI